jgi:hypothetical protein
MSNNPTRRILDVAEAATYYRDKAARQAATIVRLNGRIATLTERIATLEARIAAGPEA